MLPSVTAQALVRDLRHDLDPFPAFGADRFGLSFQPRGAEPVEQSGIGEIAFGLRLEQIGDDLPSGVAVGVEPRKYDPFVGGQTHALP